MASETARWCETCARPARLRGEVRTRIWLCGCVITPFTDDCASSVSMGALETVWMAAGDGLARYRPTRDGAIAAWRAALAEAQQREDAAAREAAMRPTEPAPVDVGEERGPCEVCGKPGAGLTLDDVELCEEHGRPYRAPEKSAGLRALAAAANEQLTQQDVARGVEEALASARAADLHAERAYHNRRTGQVERVQTFAVPLADALRTLDLDALVWVANELVQEQPERAARAAAILGSRIAYGRGGAAPWSVEADADDGCVWFPISADRWIAITAPQLADLVACMARDDG